MSHAIARLLGRSLMLLLAVCTAAGCGNEVRWRRATQVIITLRSDIAPAELASVQASIFDVRGEQRGGQHVFDLDEQRTLPLSFAVVPLRPDTKQFLVVLSGRDGDGTELVEARAVVDFVEQRTVGVQLWLYAGCKGISCFENETCAKSDSSALACVDVPKVPSEPVVPGQELDAAMLSIDPVQGPDAARPSEDAATTEPSRPDAAAVEAGMKDGESKTEDAGLPPNDATVVDPSGPCFGTPGQTICLDAVMHACDGEGRSANAQGCGSARQCQLGAQRAMCAVCLPGTHRCVGARLERCSTDGFAWQLSKTCASEALCNTNAGDCTAGACTAATRTCMGDDLYGCSEGLTQLVRLKGCDAGMCDPESGECDICLAGSRTCKGDSVDTCDDAGQKLSNAACPSSTPKCTGSGQCVQCTQASQCPAPSNNCQVATCVGSPPRCGVANKTIHQSCSGGVCNGQGSCVECADDTDCKLAGKGKCLNTRCVACKSPGDCAVGYECNLATNACDKISLAGSGTSCLSTAPGSGAMCGSYYCGVSPTRFSQAFDPTSACGPDAAFICQGTLPRIVNDCATKASLMITLSTEQQLAMTNSCIRADQGVQSRNLKQSCIDCFVSSATCCKNNSNCLTACALLFDTQAKCDAERMKAGCIKPTFACSGLPDPL